MSRLSRTRLIELVQKPLKFATLSGIGWLLDTAVYMSLVTYVGMGVFLANIAGGVCGGAFAFVTAHRFVFGEGPGKLTSKLTIYVIYTAMLVIIASGLVDLTAEGLRYLANSVQLPIAWPLIAFLAKCLITPLLLATNFFVARALSRTRWR
jgi:putative flippase GtrA